MKNSLTGNEPAPVMNYKRTCPDHSRTSRPPISSSI